MRATAAHFELNIKHLAAAVLLIGAAGSSFAATTASDNTQDAAAVQQAAKPLSKSQATRQQILQKLAAHEPLSYNEKLYLR